jgi:hypothetical protein
MARRVELGAGIGAVALALLTFVALLSAPLVAYCASPSPVQPCSAVRHESLLNAGLDTAGWLYLTGMLLVMLVAGLGAIVEARWRIRIAALPLWICSVLAFTGCAWSAGAVGMFFLPAVLAICLAAYASALQRPSVHRLFVRAVGSSRRPQQAEQQNA